MKYIFFLLTTGLFPYIVWAQQLDRYCFNADYQEHTSLQSVTAEVFNAVYRDNNGSIEESILATARPGQPLPVQLLYFRASYRQPDAVLHWASGSEQYLCCYELQKSTDGQSFNTIDTVPATGSHSSYQRQAVQPETLAFYRLKSVDKNGHVDYSAIRMLTHQQYVRPGIYPNPVTQGHFFCENPVPVKLYLYNAEGVLVLAEALPKGTSKINVRSLVPGNYFIKIGNHLSQKIIIQ